MDQIIENENSTNNEADDAEIVATPVDTLDVTALKAKLTETEQANRQLFERAKKAEGFVKVDGKWVKAAKSEPAAPRVEPSRQTGELDETQLDYLDLKGVSEQEDIDVVQSVMSRTGMTLRQALKDDYVQTKLKTNKEARDVKAAMPTSTKRSSSGADNSLDLAIARYEQSGLKELPQDVNLRRQVVNAMRVKQDGNKPAWG